MSVEGNVVTIFSLCLLNRPLYGMIRLLHHNLHPVFLILKSQFVKHCVTLSTAIFALTSLFLSCLSICLSFWLTVAAIKSSIETISMNCES